MKISKIKINELSFFKPINFYEKYKIHLLFTTRNGGFSEGNFKSLNLSYQTGDKFNLVKKNRLKILSLFNQEGNKDLFSLNQIHSDNVVIINNDFLNNFLSFNNNLPNYNSYEDFYINPNLNEILKADAAITEIPFIPLTVMGADCNLILIADIKKRVIAAVHAGWKGVLNQIIIKTIKILQNDFNSNLKDVFIFIGPSIRKCCFKVKQDIFDLFYFKFKKNLIFKKTIDDEEKINYYFIDLVNLITKDLLDLGIPKNNISDLKLCTYCNEDLFFSYRRKKETGRQAGIIMIE